MKPATRGTTPEVRSVAYIAVFALVTMAVWLILGRFQSSQRPVQRSVSIATQTDLESKGTVADFEPPTILQKVLQCWPGSQKGEGSSRSVDTGESTWLETMTVSLDKIKRRRDGGIDTESYLSAMAHIPEVYDSLLSLQVVTAFMRRDLHGHMENVRRSMLAIPHGQGATLQGIIHYALATQHHRELSRKTTSMVGGVLWLNRATTFIAAFIRGLADGLDSRDAAARAYDSSLRMFHSTVTAAFVSRATSLCPDRTQILERMHLRSEDVGKQQLNAFLRAMEPLVVEIREFLDRAGANFPDRIG